MDAQVVPRRLAESKEIVHRLIKHRILGSGVVCFAALAIAPGQQPAPSQLPANEDAKASIEGRVTEVDGATPIQGAKVALRGAATGETDSAGRYVLKDVPAGDHRMSVFKEGYGRESSGDSTPLRRMRLLPGQRLSGVDFQLKKEAVVGGRVYDVRRNPAVGVHVNVWGISFEYGRKIFWLRGSVRTDDLGEYRLAGLTEGSWYVGAIRSDVARVHIPPRRRATGETIGQTKGTSFVVFYPNAPSLTSAEPLYLRGGEERTAVDLSLVEMDTFCVVASVTANGGSARYYVHLSPHSPGWRSRVIASAPLGAHRELEICQLPPGSYQLQVSAGNERGAYAELFFSEFEIINRDVRLGYLHPQPVMKAPGKVVMAHRETATELPGGISVGLAPYLRFPYMGENASASVDPSGDFVLPGLFPGLYWRVFVGGLPRGYYIKESSMGSGDPRREPVRAGSGELRIVLASDGASLRGKVLGKDDEPVADATAVLAPVPLPLTGSPDLVRTQATDQNGQFELESIAPGEYRLLAFTGLLVGQGEAPDFLRGYLTRAAEVTLEPRQTKNVTVSVIPIP